MLLQVGFGVVCVGLGAYFLRSERAELSHVSESLVQADAVWFLAGLLLVVAFVAIQGWMYRLSFLAVGRRARLSTGILLFLKRNLISVFLPAGVLTNLAFFNREVTRRDGVDTRHIYFASAIFSFCSILTGILVGIPAGAWLFLREGLSGRYVAGIAFTSGLLLVLGWAVTELLRQGPLYRWLDRRFPAALHLLGELRAEHVDATYLWKVTGLSLLIEAIGIAQLYVAAAALDAHPTLELAVMGYGVALLLLMSSPFLRGIGAIEVALTFALGKFGLTTVLALSVAFLFRFFEFWSVLVLGLIALVWRRDLVVYRVWPAVLLFVLGTINVWSALTPALVDRLRTLRELLPLGAIQLSNGIVLISGILLLLLSYYLLRGYRRAYVAALALALDSLAGHLAKGIDWEEASLAAVTAASLLVTRREYFVSGWSTLPVPTPASVDRARQLVRDHGRSSLDYFKTYSDKLLWFDLEGRGFVAYRTALGYAVVLEGPVCADSLTRRKLIEAFDGFARGLSLRTGYYRVAETDRAEYLAAGKLLFPIGEEATVDLTTWSLQGSSRKELRNALNKMTKQGFAFAATPPPQQPAFLQQLRAVSDDWLREADRSELAFSQGTFAEDELAAQTILSVRHADGRIVAFVNVIPSGVAGEATFDLMRKTTDAPNGAMDFLFCHLFDYFRDAGFTRCNLGMVPMSGIENPATPQEQALKLAYERLRAFAHYRSLRHFKEKFDPEWQMMYLAYSAPIDLLELPLALERVVRI